jgi:alpha-L-rhamnosidase
MIILDYGRDLGCIPVFDVVSVSGTPTLRAIYSEGQPFLLPSGDGAAPSGGGVTGGRVGNLSFVGNLGGGDLSRVNDYPLQGPRLIVHRLIQGGERWQAITLARPRLRPASGIGQFDSAGCGAVGFGGLANWRDRNFDEGQMPWRD